MCVEGKVWLYEFCEAMGVNYRPCGKLLVATGPSKLDQLQDIQVRALANGVVDLLLLDRS